MRSRNRRTNRLGWMLGTVVGGIAIVVGSVAAAPPYQASFLTLRADRTSAQTRAAFLDADAIPDLLYDATVLRGVGDGTYTTVQTITLTGGPHVSAIGDLNDDGRPDLVFLDPGSVTTLFNQGDGTFGAQQVQSSGGHRAMIVDLNHDDLGDLVALGSSGGTPVLTSRLGNGDGTYAATIHTVATPTNTTGLTTADLDSDGDPDAVVTSANGVVTTYRGNGDGTFQAGADHSAGPGALSSAVGDLNGDTRPDVVTVVKNTHRLHVFLGVGDGTLKVATPPWVAVPVHPASAVVRDFDGNGTQDVVVASGDVNTFQVATSLSGNGDGSFVTQGSFDIEASSYEMAGVDVDLDGAVDVVVGNSVVLGNGDGTFGRDVHPAAGAAPVGLAVGDLNHDAKTDVVVANNGGASISVVLGNGGGSFAPSVAIAAPVGPLRASVVDLNHDTHMDIVLGTGSGIVSVYLGVGDGSFPTRQDTDIGNNVECHAVADFNEDGHLDVIAGDFSNTRYTVLRGVGDGTFLPMLSYSMAPVRPIDMALGDLDDDGHLDLFVSGAYAYLGGTPEHMILLGNGDGTFQHGDAPTTFYCGSPSCGLRTAMGDLDEDGNADVVFSDGSGLRWFRGLGDGQLQPGILLFENTTGMGVKVADIDGDGHLDIATTSPNSITLLFGDGDGGFPTKRTYGTGQAPYDVVLADLGGPGPSLITSSHYDQRISVLPAQGTLLDVPVVGGPRVRLAVHGFPNPVRSLWSVELELARAGASSLEIYDLAGRRVRTLLERTLEPGRHPALWDLQDHRGHRVPPGVYVCLARNGGESVSRRVVVLP